MNTATIKTESLVHFGLKMSKTTKARIEYAARQAGLKAGPWLRRLAERELLACSKHPKYKGIRQPRAACADCLAIWRNR